MKRRDSSRILVVGAGGYFGSLVVEDVLRHTDSDVWNRWAGWLAPAMAPLGFLGHDWGAVGVEAAGSAAGVPIRRQACVIAEASGPGIAAMPAAIMAGRLLSGATAERGLAAVDNWLTRAELEWERYDGSELREKTTNSVPAPGREIFCRADATRQAHPPTRL